MQTEEKLFRPWQSPFSEYLHLACGWSAFSAQVRHGLCQISFLAFCGTVVSLLLAGSRLIGRWTERLRPCGLAREGSSKGRRALSRLRAWNSEESERRPLGDEFRRCPVREFEGEIEALGEVPGRDLGAWKGQV